MGISTEPLKVVIDGTTYNAEQGVIEESFLGFEDHGLLTYSLLLDLGSGHQAFGNRTPDDWRNALIYILNSVGVNEWRQLVGKSVFALYDSERPRGLIRGILSNNMKRAYLPDAVVQEYVSS